MSYNCTSCKKLVAQYDNQEFPQLQPVNGAELQTKLNEAARVRCKCGRVMILLTGSAM